MSAPGFVIVSEDDEDGNASTVHTAVTDKSGIQKLVTLSEVSSMQEELPTEPTTKRARRSTRGDDSDVGTRIQCGHCNKSFVSVKSVQRHRKTVHPDIPQDKETVIKLHQGHLQIPDGNPSSSVFEISWLDPNPRSVEAKRAELLVKDEAVVAKLEHELKSLSSKKGRTKPKVPYKKTHECKECSKTFPSPSMLKRHSVVHTGEKPFQCRFCGNRYSQRERLRRHMGTHTGLNIFVCKACGKQFEEKCRYVDHVRSHIEEKPYECEICSKGFTNRVGLWKHSSMHTGDKKYYGESCGEYRFQCEICSKKFRLNQELVRHSRTHTGKTPDKIFQCPHCPKKFSRKSLLDPHVRSHTGEKPFLCPHCLRMFACKRTLAYHLKLHKLGVNMSGEGGVLGDSATQQYSCSVRANQANSPSSHQCKSCHARFQSLPELVEHIEESHVRRESDTTELQFDIQYVESTPLLSDHSTLQMLQQQPQIIPSTVPQNQQQTNMEHLQSISSTGTVSSDSVIPLQQFSYSNIDDGSTFVQVTQDQLNSLNLSVNPHIILCLPNEGGGIMDSQEIQQEFLQVVNPTTASAETTQFIAVEDSSTIAVSGELENAIPLSVNEHSISSNNIRIVDTLKGPTDVKGITYTPMSEGCITQTLNSQQDDGFLNENVTPKSCIQHFPGATNHSLARGGSDDADKESGNSANSQPLESCRSPEIREAIAPTFQINTPVSVEKVSTDPNITYGLTEVFVVTADQSIVQESVVTDSNFAIQPQENTVANETTVIGGIMPSPGTTDVHHMKSGSSENIQRVENRPDAELMSEIPPNLVIRKTASIGTLSQATVSSPVLQRDRICITSKDQVIGNHMAKDEMHEELFVPVQKYLEAESAKGIDETVHRDTSVSSKVYVSDVQKTGHKVEEQLKRSLANNNDFPDRSSTFAPVELLQEFMPQKRSRRRSV